MVERDPYKVEDTGHEWDGIRELKNDPPRWWMISLYLSGVFLFLYFLLYPAIPLVNDYTRGVLGWTQIKEYKERLRVVENMREPYEKRLVAMTGVDIVENAEMTNFAVAAAKTLFGDNCAPCHGAGGQGAPGFPVLADDDWLYGGTMDAIMETITEGRQGYMPGYKDTLSEQEINNVVRYVVGLPGGEVYQPGRAVFLGQTQGAAECASCHGEDAKGMVEMGAPNLADAIWRFSGEEDEVRRTILHGVNNEGDSETRRAVMPSFKGKFDETRIKELAVKVFMLGGGRKG